MSLLAKAGVAWASDPKDSSRLELIAWLIKFFKEKIYIKK